MFIFGVKKFLQVDPKWSQLLCFFLLSWKSWTYFLVDMPRIFSRVSSRPLNRKKKNRKSPNLSVLWNVLQGAVVLWLEMTLRLSSLWLTFRHPKCLLTHERCTDRIFRTSQTAADGWQIQHTVFDLAKIIYFTFMETACFCHEVSMQAYFSKGSGYISNKL